MRWIRLEFFMRSTKEEQGWIWIANLDGGLWNKDYGIRIMDYGIRITECYTELN